MKIECKKDSAWISVKDRLPRKEDGGETGEVMVGGFHEETNQKLARSCAWSLMNPESWYSHWMRIPELPQDEAQAAFERWYEPSATKHRKEQQEAFVAAYRIAKEGGQQ